MSTKVYPNPELVQLPDGMPEALKYLKPAEPKEDPKKAQQRNALIASGIQKIVGANTPDGSEPDMTMLIGQLRAFQERYNVTDNEMYQLIVDGKQIPVHIQQDLAALYKKKLGKVNGYNRRKQEQVWINRAIMQLSLFTGKNNEKNIEENPIENNDVEEKKVPDKSMIDFVQGLYHLAARLQFKLPLKQRRALANICEMYIQLCKLPPLRVVDEGYFDQQTLHNDIKRECEKLYMPRSGNKSRGIYCLKTALMVLSISLIVISIAALIVSFGGSAILSGFIGTAAASALSSVIGTSGATAVATIGSLAGGSALTIAAVTDIAIGVASSFSFIAAAVAGCFSLAYSYFCAQQPAKEFVKEIRGSERMQAISNSFVI